MTQTIEKKEFIYVDGNRYCFDVFKENCHIATNYTRYTIIIYLVNEKHSRHWFYKDRIKTKVKYEKLNKDSGIEVPLLRSLTTKELVQEILKIIDKFMSDNEFINSNSDYLGKGFDEHFDGYIGMNDEQKRTKAIEQIII